MSDTLRKHSFSDLLSKGKIRIPKIQRDYAQGRLCKSVDEIRKVFVHTLLLVVKGKRPATELDFVYGSDKNNAFEPLDGQQRLTTLFLLYWMMGMNLGLPDDKKQSFFTYETRNTSHEFCDELIQHKASIFIKESFAEDAEGNRKSISQIIKHRDWFKWEWNYDPTILSMLVMIDAINAEMGEDWRRIDISVLQKNLEHITFNLLDLGEFGLSNELFIKMNARGKQLSDFDKLKSTLEEELQIQQKETTPQGKPLTTREDEEQWRTLMDGVWIDLFWHKYFRNEVSNHESTDYDEKGRLELAKLSETQFKKLLLRLIALQLFESENVSEELMKAAYNLGDPQIDNLLFCYTDSLADLRSDEQHVVVPQSQLTLNFNRLIEDFNSLIYRDASGVYDEISGCLDEESHIHNDKKTVFDCFLETRVPNDVELVFYAMLLFLRAFPFSKKKINGDEQTPWYFDTREHKQWLKNFETWVRVARNILLNDNNNQRIDKIQGSRDATFGLKQMVTDLVDYVNDDNLEKDEYVVRKFLNSSAKTYQGIDNQSLAEERYKARLIIENHNWESAINAAESHPYLWGQIRCLLDWSDGKLDMFNVYCNKLAGLLNVIKDNANLYYDAILVFCPDCWVKSNRLYQYNKDRDNSFKRYLRDREGDKYGAVIKDLIDLWINQYNSFNAEVFLNKLVEDRKEEAPVWIQCIAECPEILDEARYKRIFLQDNQIVLAQLKTEYSHCFDPVLLYLRNKCEKIGNCKFNFYDSKGDYNHAFQLEKDGHNYFVQRLKDGYSIKKDNVEIEKDCSPEKVKVYMLGIINGK